MRITGGSFRGRRLKGPRGRSLRPTSDMVRKAIFDVLGPEGAKGRRVLDLFAGSGALGFEALSRGAQEVVFVEKDKGAADLIKQNIQALDVLERTRVFNLEAKKAIRVLAERGWSFDLILLDPPYKEEKSSEVVLREIIDRGILVPGGVLVLEHSALRAPSPPEGLNPVRVKRYGDTAVSFFIREA